MLLTAIVSYRLPRIVTMSPTSSILSFCPRRPWASKASIATLRDSRWTELLKVYWEVKTSNLKLNRDQLTEKLKFNQVVGYSSDLCPDRLLGQVLHLQPTRVMSVVMTNVSGWKKIQQNKVLKNIFWNIRWYGFTFWSVYLNKSKWLLHPNILIIYYLRESFFCNSLIFMEVL